MKACASCPNRHMARLFRSMGDEEVAREIEDAGCQWWQILPVKEEPGHVEGCMAANLRLYLQRYGQDVLLASDAIQKDRNEQAKALEKVREAAEVLGLDQAVGYLAALGFQGAVAKELEAGRATRALENGKQGAAADS